MGMLRERGRAITRLLPAAVMNTEYRANKRLYEFTERGGREREQKGQREKRESSEARGKRRSREEGRRMERMPVERLAARSLRLSHRNFNF